LLAAKTHEFVMPGLVPGIHVLLNLSKKDVDGRDRRAEATPSFGRLCPAMTRMEVFPAAGKPPKTTARQWRHTFNLNHSARLADISTAPPIG
jgi:hypothetical protein